MVSYLTYACQHTVVIGLTYIMFVRIQVCLVVCIQIVMCSDPVQSLRSNTRRSVLTFYCLHFGGRSV
jgi:hypothetical protein